jgi:hypothetical protein
LYFIKHNSVFNAPFTFLITFKRRYKQIKEIKYNYYTATGSGSSQVFSTTNRRVESNQSILVPEIDGANFFGLMYRRVDAPSDLLTLLKALRQMFKSKEDLAVEQTS